jgi:hypothetical protein
LHRFAPAGRDLDDVAGATQQLGRQLRRAWLVINDK